MDMNYRKNQSEKILELIKDERFPPFKKGEMLYFLSVPDEEKEIFYDILNELERDGKILLSKKGKLLPVDEKYYVSGVFLGTHKGFGFVRREKNAENSSDIFIPEESINGARHKDKVLCKIKEASSDGKRHEGEIIKILERGFPEIVGIYEDNIGFGFVYPDDAKISSKIFISGKRSNGAVNGHKVLVNITKSDADGNNEGEITGIIGHVNDPGVDILSILLQLGIRTEYSGKVMGEVSVIADTIDPNDINGRTDMRNEVLITIDGENAKDLDDAVSIKLLENGNYELGVHIADVTHYVKENSALDKEALKRGTSVYVPGRVVPMLPHKLSNGICSLNANEDRLALSCIMEINEKGNVVSHRIIESVICVKERLSYDIVADILTNEQSAWIERYSEYINIINQMKALAAILREKRVRRGSVEFSFTECNVLVDENGRAVDIIPSKRNVATSIIEEFMLICNETVAEQFCYAELPFVYRTHEMPNAEKMENLSILVKNLGYKYKIKNLKAASLNLQTLLSDVSGTPEEALIHKMALRSMKQARYSHENTGHFGLAAKYYCHFTSPIRRYPDLQIHRIIKESLNGLLTENRINHYENILDEICRQCSQTERTAEEAEREADDLKKAEYMSDKIDNEYEGIVSGVTNWGLFVELPNTVEGMISVADMPERFIFDEKNMQLVSAESMRCFRLGDNVRIIVIKTDINNRKISFGLAE